jgi:hypothetical protein
MDEAFAGIDVAFAKGKRLPVVVCRWQDRTPQPLGLRNARAKPPTGKGNAGALVNGAFTITFGRSALVRNDVKSLHDSLARGIQSGIYSQNDARKMLGSNPIADDDRYLMNSALVPIADAGQLAASQPRGNPAIRRDIGDGQRDALERRLTSDAELHIE